MGSGNFFGKIREIFGKTAEVLVSVSALITSFLPGSIKVEPNNTDIGTTSGNSIVNSMNVPPNAEDVGGEFDEQRKREDDVEKAKEIDNALRGPEQAQYPHDPPTTPSNPGGGGRGAGQHSSDPPTVLRLNIPDGWSIAPLPGVVYESIHPQSQPKYTDQQLAKGTEQQPAKGTDQQPAKSAEQQPAKGTKQQPAKDANQQPAKGANQQPAKGENDISNSVNNGNKHNGAQPSGGGADIGKSVGSGGKSNSPSAGSNSPSAGGSSPSFGGSSPSSGGSSPSSSGSSPSSSGGGPSR